MKRALPLLVILLAVAPIVGCGSTSNRAKERALAGLDTPAPPQQRVARTRPSLYQPDGQSAPPAVMPAPGAMPAGSFMAKIKRRGHLIAGVNAAFLGFGYLNPFKGIIEGSRSTSRVRWPRRSSAIQRRSAQGSHGAPADTVRPGRRCRHRRRRGDHHVHRRTKVDFSTVYYDAHQRLLVPRTSRARGLQDLGGKRVCATAQSAPITVIENSPSHPIAVSKPQAIDCWYHCRRAKSTRSPPTTRSWRVSRRRTRTRRSSDPAWPTCRTEWRSATTIPTSSASSTAFSPRCGGTACGRRSTTGGSPPRGSSGVASTPAPPPAAYDG